VAVIGLFLFYEDVEVERPVTFIRRKNNFEIKIKLKLKLKIKLKLKFNSFKLKSN
jgi:hypothetical protein